MKKLIPFLFIFFAALTSFRANAQYCGQSEVTFPACGIQTNYGFGDDNTYPCFTVGQCDTLTIPFKVYPQFTAAGNTVSIYKLKIDKIDSLPCGLCWSTSASADDSNEVNEFDPSENGCIRISGMTNDAPGFYLLSMILNVQTTPSCATCYQVDSINSAAGSIYLWVKVVAAGGQCPDTITATPTQTMHPSTNCGHLGCPAGISEVSRILNDLNIQPNPVTGTAKVTFNSENGGAQNIIITDLLGSEVYRSTMTAKQGANETIINRSNLAAGVYILSVGNSEGTATRKFVIGE